MGKVVNLLCGRRPWKEFRRLEPAFVDICHGIERHTIYDFRSSIPRNLCKSLDERQPSTLNCHIRVSKLTALDCAFDVVRPEEFA